MSVRVLSANDWMMLEPEVDCGFALLRLNFELWKNKLLTFPFTATKRGHHLKDGYYGFPVSFLKSTVTRPQPKIPNNFKSVDIC